MSLLRSLILAPAAVLGLTGFVSAQQRSWMQTSAKPQGPAWTAHSALAPAPQTAVVAPRSTAVNPAATMPPTVVMPAPAPYVEQQVATSAQMFASGGHYPLPGLPNAQSSTVATSAFSPVAQASANIGPSSPSVVDSQIVPTAAYAAPVSPRNPTRSPFVAPAGHPAARVAQVNSGFAGPTMAPPAGSMMPPGATMPGSSSTGPLPYSTPAPAGGWASGLQPDPISSDVAPNYGGPAMGGANNGGPYAAPYASAPYSDAAPDFYPCDPGIQSCGPWFFAGSGLIMTRDVPNNVELAASSVDPAVTLVNTERVGIDWTAGFETRLGRSFGERWGIEAVYWMLAPTDDQVIVRSEANQINSRLDFQNLFYQGSPLSDVYNNSREQRFSRHNSFQNIEINVLQQAIAVDPAGHWGMMFFFGARYFRFNEKIKYDAVAANSEFSDNDPNTQSDYWIREDNNLVGGQFGGRLTMFVGNRLRLYAMPRFGVFNNHIIQQQHVCMVIDQHASKDDVALLGQLDLGASFQVFRCCSVYGGYRVMSLTGVAVADDNISRTFLSPGALESVNSASGLILHGAQAGIQWQF